MFNPVMSLFLKGTSQRYYELTGIEIFSLYIFCSILAHKKNELRISELSLLR
jgi:hypothetical protein